MTAVGYLIPKFICEEFPEDYSDVLDVVEVDGRLCFTSSEHGPDDEASVTPAPDLTMPIVVGTLLPYSDEVVQQGGVLLISS